MNVVSKQKSYKCDNQLITWLTGIARPAGSCNLVTLKTNFAQYKNFVWWGAYKSQKHADVILEWSLNSMFNF